MSVGDFLVVRRAECLQESVNQPCPPAATEYALVEVSRLAEQVANVDQHRGAHHVELDESLCWVFWDCIRAACVRVL